MVSIKFDSKLVRYRRKELEMTQQQVAEKSSISTLGYRLIELGKKEPKSNTIARIAQSLHKPIDYFFSN